MTLVFDASKIQEDTVDTKRIYEGKIVNLRVDTVKLPDGRTSTREVVEHSAAVAIIPLLDQNRIVMVRQYRYPIGRVTLEIPAGKVDRDEEIIECARRELEEETGYVGASFQKILSFYTTPGFSDEIIHIFIARGLSRTAAHPDEDEFIQTETVTLDEAIRMVKNGVICDAKTTAALLFLKIQGE